MTPDIINGLFEVFGGVFITMSIIKLHRDKQVAGVNWLMIAFFAAWGYWNLYFYPSLGQWWSFWGGIGVVITNTIYLGMLIYYSRRAA